MPFSAVSVTWTLSQLNLSYFLGHDAVVVRSCEEETLDATSLLSLATENLSEEVIRQIFAGVRQIITLALRQPNLKAEVRSCISRLI